MLRFWKRRAKIGVLTEDKPYAQEMAAIRKEIKSRVHKHFAGSLAIRMVDSGSCNACEAECNALSNPYYNLESLGIYFVASPRHADLLLLSGVVTSNMLPHLLDAYAQIPEPKWVVTIGDCPLMQAPFEKSFAIAGPASAHLPVAYHISGCPPSPDEIIKGLLGFLRTL